VASVIGSQGTAAQEGDVPGGRELDKSPPPRLQWATLIPTVYNADTLGIRPDLIKRPIGNWKDALNPEFKGKASRDPQHPLDRASWMRRWWWSRTGDYK